MRTLCRAGQRGRKEAGTEKSESPFFWPIHLFASLKFLKSWVKEVEKHFGLFDFKVKFRKFFGFIFLNGRHGPVKASQTNVAGRVARKSHANTLS